MLASAPGPKAYPSRKLILLVDVLLIVSTFLIYFQVVHHDFINLDDNVYVFEEPHVQKGLSWENVYWAFVGATFESNYWQPLTWLSHMMDYQLYGMQAGMHHLTNLFLHIAGVLLLFHVLLQMTGCFYRSAFVAGIFAVHPMHAESVAWIAERKDVLSAVFWFLTMAAYTAYVKRKTRVRYLMAFMAFMLCCMSKPMVVTLPFVLLLLDYWPFQRLSLIPTESNLQDGSWLKNLGRLVFEKLPFFAIAGLFSVATYFTQKVGGALTPLNTIPLATRINVVVLNYFKYLANTFWPFRLSALYPYPEHVPLSAIVMPGLVVLLITIMAIKLNRRYPYVLMGWLWYLGTLVPVIGLVIIGPHAMADRYAYLPHVGIFLILAWGVSDALKNLKFKKQVLGLTAGVFIACMSLTAWIQLGYWTDSVRLFSRALQIIGDHPVTHDIIGYSLAKKGRYGEAISHLKEAIRLKPASPNVHYNLAQVYTALGELDNALYHYRKVIEYQPKSADALNNMGNIYLRKGDIERSARCYRMALKINPRLQIARKNLSKVKRLLKVGK